MGHETLLELAKTTLVTALMICAPALLVGMCVGLCISLFCQSVYQNQNRRCGLRFFRLCGMPILHGCLPL